MNVYHTDTDDHWGFSFRFRRPRECLRPVLKHSPRELQFTSLVLGKEFARPQLSSEGRADIGGQTARDTDERNNTLYGFGIVSFCADKMMASFITKHLHFQCGVWLNWLSPPLYIATQEIRTFISYRFPFPSLLGHPA